MATVISLTEEKIRELLNGWEEVGLSQEQIDALVSQIAASQASVNAAMDELNSTTLPQLEQNLAEGSVKIDELNETTLPNLEQALEQANQDLQNLQTVDIPAIQQDVANQIVNARERPKVFVQPDPPPPYDDLEDRDLVVGDTWFDSDDENKQRIWNGVEWSTFNVDVHDFSLTVRKFMTSTHMIY